MAPKQDMGRLVFTREEREKMAAACQILGITFVEFVHIATLQALDEVDGLMAEVTRARRAKVYRERAKRRV